MELQTETRTVNSAAVVDVSGEVDAYTSPKLDRAIESAVSSGVSQVVVDLSATSYLDSSGLTVLIKWLKRQRMKGGDLLLVGLRPNVRKVFTITGLDRVFPLSESIEEALAAGRTEGA